MDDYSEELQDKTTVGSWRRPAYIPRSRQSSMPPRQGSGKTEQKMSRILQLEIEKGVALQENQRPSEVAAALEAAWRAFIRDMMRPFLQKW